MPYRFQNLLSGPALVAAGAFLISFSSVFMVMSGVAPSTAAFYRTALAVPPLFILSLAYGSLQWKGARFTGIMLLAGLAYCLDLISWHASILLVGPGLSTILANFQVFILAGFSILILKTPLSGRLLLSLPVAIAGLYLIFGLNWEGSSGGYHLGVLFGLFSAVAYAVYLLLLRFVQIPGDLKGNIPVLLIVTATTAVLSGLYSIGEGTSLAVQGAGSWIPLIAYGLICQFIAWILIAEGLTRTNPMNAGLILLLQPTFAFIWDILIFHLHPSPAGIAGVIVTLLAIYLGTSAGGRTNPSTLE
jgi:drug/metabolite transporter (DMT)-like permease